ncbi:Sec2p domain-containing protein [Favolaschia claudopus]|uniref:Sec2p domain-containing protein n=1 Tax=Favolaschia claudopus TaxID=2862362 RepID=A0AAV9ZCC2_9AGAR
MLHFPSVLQNGPGSGSGVPRRTDSLNATQQAAKTPSNPIFLTIEQELHDARRVSSHGQEEDLRSALNMVINRVTELSSLLSEAYKSKAELELQLNVAKSNLQLVIANNEMLEEALKSGNGGRASVGWRRSNGPNAERHVSLESQQHSPASNDSPTDGSSSSTNSSFFKTFFHGTTRPTTPTQHFTSPSLPSLHTGGHDLDDQAALSATRAAADKARQDAERERQLAIRERKAADQARALAASAAREKVALEAELESLSQALFEEANKMVASERKRRAEAEGEVVRLRAFEAEVVRARRVLVEEGEELREAREEREALKRALRVVEGENVELRSASRMSGGFGGMHSSQSSLDLAEGGEEGRAHRLTRSRSSSEVGTKSPVRSSPSSSPHIPASSPRIPPSASSPHIPAPAAPPSTTRHEEEDEEPITFAPTGLGLRSEADDTDDDGDARPTPRRGALVDLPATEVEEEAAAADLDAQVVETEKDEEEDRASSPGLSPPPTAVAPAVGEPWAQRV